MSRPPCDGWPRRVSRCTIANLSPLPISNASLVLALQDVPGPSQALTKWLKWREPDSFATAMPLPLLLATIAGISRIRPDSGALLRRMALHGLTACRDMSASGAVAFPVCGGMPRVPDGNPNTSLPIGIGIRRPRRLPPATGYVICAMQRQARPDQPGQPSLALVRLVRDCGPAESGGRHGQVWGW